MGTYIHDSRQPQMYKNLDVIHRSLTRVNAITRGMLLARVNAPGYRGYFLTTPELWHRQRNRVIRNMLHKWVEEGISQGKITASLEV